MIPLLTHSERVIAALCRALVIVVGFVAMVMMLNVVADVTAKYLFHRPIYGTSELVGNYYMIAIVFLSVPLVELQNRQIYVDLFFGMFPRAVQVACLALTFVLQCGFHAVLGYESLNAAVEAMQKREIVEGFVAMSIWPARYLLVVGFALGFVIAVLRLLQTVFRHPAIEEYLSIAIDTEEM